MKTYGTLGCLVLSVLHPPRRRRGYDTNRVARTIRTQRENISVNTREDLYGFLQRKSGWNQDACDIGFRAPFLSFVAKNVAAVSYRAGFFVTAGA